MRFGMRLVRIRQKLMSNVLGKPQIGSDERLSLLPIVRGLETHCHSMICGRTLAWRMYWFISGVAKP